MRVECHIDSELVCIIVTPAKDAIILALKLYDINAKYFVKPKIAEAIFKCTKI